MCATASSAFRSSGLGVPRAPSGGLGPALLLPYLSRSVQAYPSCHDIAACRTMLREG